MVELRVRDIIKIERPGDPNKGITEKPDFKRFKESSDFVLRRKTIEDRVKSILQGDKYAREDDLWLLLMYYVKCNMIKVIVPLQDFQKSHKPESITRARRHLVEKAKKVKKNGEPVYPDLQFLLNNQEVLDIRKNEEQKYREYYGRRNFKKKESWMSAHELVKTDKTTNLDKDVF